MMVKVPHPARFSLGRMPAMIYSMRMRLGDTRFLPELFHQANEGWTLLMAFLLTSSHRHSAKNEIRYGMDIGRKRSWMVLSPTTLKVND